MKRAWFGLLLALLALTFGAPAIAHETRPGYLELVETTPGHFNALWKVPAVGDRVLALHAILPAACKTIGEPMTSLVDGAQLRRWAFECDANGLDGHTIAIDGLGFTQVDVLVRIQWLSGAKLLHILRPSATSFVVDSKAQRSPVFGYLTLGIEHILLGIDHLLFVLGLLLIVRGRATLIKTITAFTLAHSITLAIATLGLAHAPLEPLNAAIALSILFLGPEIVRTWRGETSLTIRYPWVVAFVFGLLHGFGFASGLSTTGLGPTELAFALLWFNVGVELGQLSFVALMLALAHSFRVLQIRWPRVVEALPGYAVGSLGAMWTIQRTFVLFEVAR